MSMAGRVIALVLLAALAAAPAGAQGVPEPMRGTWIEGDCAAPAALLHVTARGVVRLPAAGSARLVRFRSLGEHAGWILGTGGGGEAPRVMLRAAGDGLDSIEPDAKTRDDRLPGDAPTRSWRRCPAPPAILAALHGEGLAFLGAAERLEAACQGGPVPDCIAALLAEGDVSGDARLGVAEVARLLRGAAWALAAREGASIEALGAAAGIGGVAGLAAARILVDGLDFDGDGRLSAAELAQDRAAWPGGAGAASGRPVLLETLAEGAGLLRGMIEAMGEP